MTTHALHLEEFNGATVSFRNDGWVNATQMAKPFGKRTLHFLQLLSTKAFVGALAKDSGVMTESPSSLVETIRGVHSDGRQQGTWMHPDLALEFARWLSPEFAIWTNRVIRRVLSGQPAQDLTPVLQSLARAVEQVATAQATMMGKLDTVADAHASLSQRVATLEDHAPRARLYGGGRPKQYSAEEFAGLFPMGYANRLPVIQIQRQAEELLGMSKATFFDYRFQLASDGVVKKADDGRYYRPDPQAMDLPSAALPELAPGVSLAGFKGRPWPVKLRFSIAAMSAGKRASTQEPVAILAASGPDIAGDISTAEGVEIIDGSVRITSPVFTVGRVVSAMVQALPAQRNGAPDLTQPPRLSASQIEAA